MLNSGALPLVRSTACILLAAVVVTAPLTTGAVQHSKGLSTAAGQKVYADNRCAGCHSMSGTGGKSGPDLSHEGKKRSAAWIAAEVADPKSHNASSKMPGYKDRIKPAELKTLAAYLASVK